MMPKDIPLHVFCYIRESSQTQFDNGYGVEDQRVEIEKCCQENNLVIEAWFKDAKSGGSAERVELTKMIDQALKRDDIRFIVVHEASRFSRNFFQTLQFERDLQKQNIYVIDPSVDIDPRSYLDTNGKIDPDRWNARMQARVSAELERRKTSTRIKSRGLQKRKAGFAVGELPYGLRVCKGPTRKYVEYNPEEALIVEDVYKMYLQTNWGFTAIARELNRKGLVRNMPYQTYDKQEEAFSTYYKQEPFTNEAVRGILTNKAYIGYQNYPPFEPLLTRVNGEKQCLKPLISQHDFDLAQETRKKNSRGKSAKGKNSSRQVRPYMVQGNIYSAVNGAKMNGCAEVRADGTVMRRYVAKTNKKGDALHIPSVRCDEVEGRVIDMFKKLEINDLEQIKTAVRNLIDADVKLRISGKFYDRGRQNDQQKLDIQKAIKALKGVLKFDDSFVNKKALDGLETKRHELERASYANFVDYYDLEDLWMFVGDVAKSVHEIQSLIAKKDLVDIMFKTVYVHKIPRSGGSLGLSYDEREATMNDAKRLKDLLQENCPRLFDKVLAEKREEGVKVWVEPSGLYLLLADPNVGDYSAIDPKTIEKEIKKPISKKKTVLVS